MLDFVRRNPHARNIMYFCIRYSGLPFIFREVFQKNKVTILFLHDIEPDIAEKVFTYLVSNYNIISLNNFFELYKRKERFPEKSLIITLDDGHKNNHSLLPLFKKYDIPATIFLCSDIIDTNRHFWFKEARSREASLPLTTEQLKKISNHEKLQILKEIEFDLKKEYQESHALSKEQIRKMQPYVDFQSHTQFHPCLPQCNDNEAHNEIFNSKCFLEKEYGLTINAIAYPNGDYSNRDIKLCNAARYEFGLTTEPGFNTCNTDPFKLKRIGVNEKSNNINEIITQASGVTGIIGCALSRYLQRTNGIR